MTADLLEATTTTAGTAAPTKPTGSEPVAQPPQGSSPGGEQKAPVESQPKDAGKEQSKPATPEKYDLKLGDKAFEHEAYAGIAKKLGLPQDTAQEILTTLAPALEERHLAGMIETRDREVERWAEEARNDRDFGGDHLAENLALVNHALNAIKGGDVMRKLLKESGYGNRLDVLQFFKELGKAIGPDTKVVRGTPGGDEPPLDPIQKLARVYERNRQ